jgi:ABC-type multidrug transport system fused ATPase/permease subunit
MRSKRLQPFQMLLISLKKMKQVINQSRYNRLGQKFQRAVGAKGHQLSGGQKQRIAIARTVIKRPMVYLFDEATSALDSENEKIVQDSLERIMQEKTAIVVSHRYTQVKKCNVIYVLKEGTIVEQGGYDELKDKKGIFYRLEKGH